MKRYIDAYIKKYPSSAKSIAEDQSIVERMNLLLQKNPLDKQDFAVLTDNLTSLMRLDDGTSVNIVGKIIGAALLDNKLNSHFEKIGGVLERS